jgi:proline iminopeptidase
LLADDIHTIRDALGITRNISILGGSWGSTLALAYALRYPQSLDELILRGVFLGTQAEVDWYTQGLARFVPEAWAQFACAGAADLVEHYYEAVNDADDKRAAEAAVRWANYEMQIMATMPIGAGGAASQSLTQTSLPSGTFVQDTLHSTRVHLHYLIHQCFLVGSPLLDAAHTIELPVTIVQGRMDLVCPPITAWQLSQRLPIARLRMVDNAGHSATSGSLALALREEVDALRDRLISQSAGGKR